MIKLVSVTIIIFIQGAFIYLGFFMILLKNNLKAMSDFH